MAAEDAIHSLVHGNKDDPDSEHVGAYLVAEFLALVRSALTQKPRG